MGRPCYIFDLDGTLCDTTHRQHFVRQPQLTVAPASDAPEAPWTPNWFAFFDACDQDLPIPHMVELARALYWGLHQIILVSGRSDQVRDKTTAWLAAQSLPTGPLYMRKERDHRPDTTVKAEMLIQIRRDGWKPIMAFDDRDSVVKMWRALGIPCAQVAEGDF